MTEQYADNRVEADHGRLQSAAVIAAGHASVQNLRRGQYELATEVPRSRRLAAAVTELATAI